MKKITVTPGKVAGSVMAPGSKSHTIRALAIAAFAQGDSVIKEPLVSDDTVSCLAALSALGAWIKRDDDSIWKIMGTSGRFLEPARILNMGNSGTGTRLFAALASLAGVPVRFDGDASLRTRPMAPLLDALTRLGVTCESTDGKSPFSVHGPLLGGETDVSGKSSQFLSALLLAAPLAPQDTILHVHDLNEAPYVGITLDWLKRQNIKLKHDSRYSQFHIEGRQQYTGFTSKIPGDFSSAAFPLVAGAVTGGRVEVRNLDVQDSQGDKAILEYLELMGAKILRRTDSVIVEAGAKLHPVELDLNATPDALPVLAAAMASVKGISVLKNVPQARIKETDRISVMAQELEKLGVAVQEFEDGMAITGGTLRPGHVDSHDDHRIAMALTVAGLAAKEDPAVPFTIDHAECISVTYPTFFASFEALGAKLYPF